MKTVTLLTKTPSNASKNSISTSPAKKQHKVISVRLLMVIVFATCWGERDSAAGLSPGWGWEPGSTRSALAGVSQRQRRAARWWCLCRQDEATGPVLRAGDEDEP